MARIEPFLIDARAVSRAEYRSFIEANPRWRRGAAPGVFVDENYLGGWAADGSDDDALATEVSWFAARAYCAFRGGRLPTTAEWEYVARADETDRDAATGADFLRRTLELAMGSRSALPSVRSGFRSVWGVWGMHGGVNEWVLDFNSIFASTDSRETTDDDRSLNCAASATTTGDSRDYAAFMRYAFRAAADARSTSRNLGFRCAADL